MHLLFQTPDSDRTVLLGDPSGHIAEILVPALRRFLEGATVRVVSSPEDPPWRRETPPWVRASWYRAVYFGLPAADRRRLALVASREAPRMQQLDPERFRSVVALVDPHRTSGFRRPTDQWVATGDALADVSGQPKSPQALVAVEQVTSSVTLVPADEPLAIVTAVAEQLGVGPKRAARIGEALRDDWPSFERSKRTPHWIDIELYAHAGAHAATDDTDQSSC
jgi:hypothetical protein